MDGGRFPLYSIQRVECRRKFNVGIICTVLGMILGRHMQSASFLQFMLEQGRSFMDYVLIRVEVERPDSKAWTTAHISILLNQALGDLEGRAADNPIPEASVSGMEQTSSKGHMWRTEDCLQTCSRFFEFNDLMEFHLSLQLTSNHCANTA